MTTDITCRNIIHNKKAAEFLRLQLQESLPDSNSLPFKMYHKDQEISPAEIPIRCAASRSEEVNDLEIEFVWDDGIHKTAVCSSSPLFDENGIILGAVAFFKDITVNMVWRHNADGTRELKSINTITGEKCMEPEEKSGDWLKIIHPDDRAKTYEAWMNAVKNKSLYEFKHRVLQPDGSYHHFVSRAVPVFDRNGELLEWIGVGKNINEYKLAEEALRESRQRLEKTVRERTKELH
ncbi:MAG TPA: hypothetical protein DCK76_08265 [Desulfotomaculum sp.]|nr:hypothetical protein [Desulfotomaculum sp.]HBY05218.1 hypothetical protein [Desulfotomaculum sp.]